MKKYYTLAAIVLLVVAVNLGFWYWASRDGGIDNVIISSDPELVDWEIYRDRGTVKFAAPKQLVKEKTEAGGYWFHSQDRKAAMIYEKFTRRVDLTIEQQMGNDIVNSTQCAVRGQNGNFTVFESCALADSLFSFVGWEKGNELLILSLNQAYLSPRIILHIINSIE